MLTRELGIVRYDRARAIPDRIAPPDLPRYAAHAERALKVYRLGRGQTRQELHRSVHNLLAHESDCPIRRLDAFCKLLDDASEYERDEGREAAALRQKVFRLAAQMHPLVRTADRMFEHAEAEAKTRIAAELGMPWPEIDRALFADVMEFHRLKAFRGYPDADSFLNRYNVAQLQVALFDAVQMTVWATDDFKTLLRYAKLARLMHTLRRLPDGRYEIQVDGPSSVLRQTRRYGVWMAKFLPALLACKGWRMHARLQVRRGWYVALDLSPQDGYKSHLPSPAEFDSNLEEDFSRKWGDGKREGWSLIREGEILCHHQKVFVPDFAFRHDDGRTALLEIIGFWTPEYLEAKRQTLKLFPHQPILLAVAEGVARQATDWPPDVIRFKTALKVSDVLARLRACSGLPSQPDAPKNQVSV